MFTILMSSSGSTMHPASGPRWILVEVGLNCQLTGGTVLTLFRLAGVRRLFRGGVGAQHLYKVGNLLQVAQGKLGGFRLVALVAYIHIEVVFPRTAAHRTGLDLAQVEVAQREHAQGLEENSGNVLQGECEGGLVGTRQHAPVAADQEKAREILLV